MGKLQFAPKMMDTLALFKDPFAFVSGVYYGIPTCCICYFISIPIADRSADVGAVCRAFRAGYVPCSDCARKILHGEAQLDELIQGRRAKKEFPSSHSPSDEFADNQEQFDIYADIIEDIGRNLPADIKSDLKRRIQNMIYNN